MFSKAILSHNYFPITVIKTPGKDSFRKEGFTLAFRFGGQGDSPSRQESHGTRSVKRLVTSHPQSGSRCVLSPLSPFYSVWDATPARAEPTHRVGFPARETL